MGLLDFAQPGSDPSAPNSFVVPPAELARRQQLADALMQQGSSTAPIQSPWQGAANLVKALVGSYQSAQVGNQQRLGQANSQANDINAMGIDPGTQNIPATPGQTTPALQENDQVNDATADAEDAGMSPDAALVRALTAARGGQSLAPMATSNPLAVALGAPGAPAQGNGDFYSTAMQHESGGQNIPNAAGASAAGYFQMQPGSWADVARAHPELALPANVMDASQAQQTAAYHAYVGMNAQALSAAGVPITDKNAFMTSFMGSGAGPTFINAMQQNPSAPAASMFPAAARENPTVFYANGQPFSLAQVYQRETGAFGNGNTTGFGAPPSPAVAGAAQPSPAQVAGAPAPGGSQGAGAPAMAAAAPSQANLATLAAAMQGQQPQGSGFGLIGSANAAPSAPQVDPRLAQAAALNAPLPPAAPAPGAGDPNYPPLPPARPPERGGAGAVPSAPPAPAAAPSAPAPAPAPSAPAAAQGAAAPGGMHPNVAALMSVLSDPWATPAQQQIASALISAQMPMAPTWGKVGVDADGHDVMGWISPRGPNGPQVSAYQLPIAQGAATGPGGAPIPAGVNAQKFREAAGTAAGTQAVPSAATEQEFASHLIDRPSYKEFAAVIPTWNSMQQVAKENSPAGDTALIDAAAKINNPGLAVRQGTFAVYADEQGGLNKFKGEVDKVLNQGAVLQPETRAQLLRVANEKMQAYQQAWQTDAGQSTKIATAHGLDPDRVIPQLPKINALNLNDLSTQKTQAYPVARPAPSPPAGAPPGAFLATDGAWYAPDPANPGKFLKAIP